MSGASPFDTALDAALEPTHGALRRRGWRAPGLLLPLAVLLLLALSMALPSWLTTAPPDAVDVDAILRPPGREHWFGTDELGRDLLSRVIHGTSTSLLIGIGAMAIACLGGVVLGTAAALLPWALQRPLVRLLDILLAFPELLLALLVIAVLGRGPTNTLIAVGLSHIAGYARLVRSQVLSVKLSAYVEHAVALGESPFTIVTRHIVPNTTRPLLVLATIGVGSSVLAASSLSFLGLGVVPPQAEWGALLASGRNFIDTAPWLSLLPATVVAVSVISLTLFGRRLERLLGEANRP